VKKLILFLTSILLVYCAIGCSKDHKEPTFSIYNIAKKPMNVVASYDKGNDDVLVTWTMNETNSIIGYYLSVSDSSNFDTGMVNSYPTNTLEKNYMFNVTSYLSADIDSTILYFTVSAIYTNQSTNRLIGPRADVPDSASIKRN